MNISERFIKRPIATSLLMAAIALFGSVAYRSLPVSDLPNVDFPTLLVSASLPRATPETIRASVATPLAHQPQCDRGRARHATQHKRHKRQRATFHDVVHHKGREEHQIEI